jgi:hypothetical protein
MLIVLSGIAAALTQTAAQATVPHQNLATVTAATLHAIGSLSSVILLSLVPAHRRAGTAVAGAIWRSVMPGQLTMHLSGLLNSTVIEGIYGSVTTAGSYPAGSPVREGVIAAYTHVMLILLIPATVLAIIPVAAALMIEDIHLGDTQNAVEPDGDVAFAKATNAEDGRESVHKVQI